jgi:hypothetical protein
METAPDTPDLLRPFRPLIDAQSTAAETAAEAERERQDRIENAAKQGAREAVEDGQPWRDKAALAEHLSCSVRWIEARIADPKYADDPLPFETIAGRVKFKIADVEAWRQRHPEAVDG